MGRLGNQMFQFAFMYTYSKKFETDYYFQDPSWFDEFKEDIKVLYGQNIVPIDQVAIHVRRGDYVGNPFYVQLWKTDYYKKAMELFPNEKFLVFSDDIEWCKAHFMGNQFEFSEGNDEVTDLNLMAGCKAVIIANSSFSWWGGYLSKGKVVAPKEWYSDKIERTVCPNNWIRI
jgi:hypothetical protein